MVGGVPEIKAQNVSLSSCSWWKMLDTFLCYTFPQNSYFIFCLFFVYLLYYLYLYKQLSLYCNHKYKENHQGP